MSYDTDRYLFYHTQSTALSLTECGIQICHKGHAAPPGKYPDYSMHFILEGKGVYEIGGKSYPLCAGEGFLICPGDLCLYTADTEEPWKYVYVSFRGTEAETLVKSAGVKEPAIFSFPNDEKMRQDIYAMHAAGKAGEHGGIDALGYFLLVMSRLIPKRQSEADNKADAFRVLRAKRYIEDNFAFNVRIQDVAQYAHLERSYLYRLFMRYEKMSPLEYLTEVRLSHAIALLANDSLSTAEIACAVGFFDASHFSKVFSKKYGLPPGEFRKNR